MRPHPNTPISQPYSSQRETLDGWFKHRIILVLLNALHTISFSCRSEHWCIACTEVCQCPIILKVTICMAWF